MRSPSVDAEFANKAFGELVLKMGRSKGEDQLGYTRDTFLEMLPAPFRGEPWRWLPYIEAEARDARLWRALPEHAADRLIGAALAAYGEGAALDLDDEDMDLIFWVAIMHFSQIVQLRKGARRFVQDSVGVGLFRKLFETWPMEGRDVGWD